MKVLKYSLLVLTILAFFNQPCSGEIYSTVYGKVIDEETGKGIKRVGVRVGLFFKNLGETETDDQGKFVINNIPPGKYGISFYPPEPYAWGNIDYTKFVKDPFVPKGMQIIQVEKGKNLYVVKKCKIGAVLLVRTFEKGTDIPIAGVEIHMERMITRQRSRNYQTDSQGIFRLGRLPAGKADLILQKEGLWWKMIKDVEFKYNKTTTIEVPYDKTSLTRITGRVTCQQSGAPLKDILISICSLDIRACVYSYTDDSGHFSMLDMEPGRYELTIFGNQIIEGKNEKIQINKKVILSENQQLNVNFVLDCDMVYDKRR